MGLEWSVMTPTLWIYASIWLAETLPNFIFEFLGLNEEHPLDEPYRVLFGGKRIDFTTHPRTDISQ